MWLGNARDLILSGTASVLQTVGCRDDIMLYLIQMGLDPKTVRIAKQEYVWVKTQHRHWAQNEKRLAAQCKGRRILR